MSYEANISPKLNAVELQALIEASRGGRRDYAITQRVALGILENVEELAPSLPWMSNIYAILAGKNNFGQLSWDTPERPEAIVRSRIAPSVVSMMEATGLALSSPEMVIASAGFVRSVITETQAKFARANPDSAKELESWVSQLDAIVASYAAQTVLVNPSHALKTEREKAMHAELLYSALIQSPTFHGPEQRKRYFILLRDGDAIKADQMLIPQRRLAGRISPFQNLVLSAQGASV